VGWARTAWKYFAPSPTGNVHYSTGLNRANQWWNYLTDWDLASYIIATLHAKELGLISDTGAWGASYRLDKVLTFLENRPLRPDGLPYWCYKWDAPYTTPSDHVCNGGRSGPGDAGFHLLALYLVKQAYPSLVTRINAIVDRVRPGYLANYYDAQNRLMESYDWYRYYDLQGFENFGFPVAESWQALEDALAGTPVDVYGQSLAPVETTAEPFLIGLFTLPMDSRFQEYAYRTYKAMEGRYNDPAIGKLTAWSECARDKDPYYVYEWVVKGAGETWQLQPPTDSKGNPYTPVVTSKAAFGYHALYHTPYTQNLMSKVLSKTQTSNIGFTEGTDEGTGGNVGNGLKVATDKTNSLIISAALYAIRHPALTATPMLPANGASVSSPVELKVRVTSSGRAVSGATVKFFVNDVEVVSGLSAVTGYASYIYTAPSLAAYSWYAKTEKSGYSTGTSLTRTFTVSAIYVATITGVVVVPDAAHVGQGSRMTFTVSADNTGPSDIASAMVKVKIRKPGGAVAGTLSKPISAFMHGSSRSVDVVYILAASAPTGTWTYNASLYRLTTLLDDYTGQTFTVETPVKTGTIVSVVDSPDPVLHGHTATFTVTFRNTGNIVWSSARITVKIYKPGGTVLATQRMLTVMNVAPGVEYTRNLTWLVPATSTTGEYTYTVTLTYLTTIVATSTGNTLTVN
jgi:hypothetical protein